MIVARLLHIYGVQDGGFAVTTSEGLLILDSEYNIRKVSFHSFRLEGERNNLKSLIVKGRRITK